MPELTGSVGTAGDNKKHDVTLVEAMLRLVKNAKKVSYYKGTWDGSFGGGLKTAITAFQTDNGLLGASTTAAPPGATEKSGLVALNSKTFKALADALAKQNAGKYDALRVLPDTKVAYLGAADADRVAGVQVIKQGFFMAGKTKVPAELEPTFRQQVIDVIDAVFKAHKIVLGGWGPKSFRRTFADQHAVLAAGTSKAGPGESNHQYGQAIDVGYKGVQLVKEDGTIQTITNENDIDNHVAGWQREALYQARNKIAEHPPQGSGALFRIRLKDKKGVPQDNDPNHFQAFSQEATLYPGEPTVSMQNSLAAHLINVSKLLDTTGLKAAKLEPPATMKWEGRVKPSRYACDFGFGGNLFEVGTADNIWLGNAAVSNADLAQALTAAAKAKNPKAPAVNAAAITAAQVAAMQKALKEVFDLAEQKWDQWKPLP
jgi:peptidoglycan hydrolase-like protein with peptidoglycan-binding domain